MIDHNVPPKQGCMVLTPLMGRIGEVTDEERQTIYEEKIVNFEKKCEQILIETLKRLNINAMTKTDRYSLPYQQEVLVTLNGESYMNGPYEFYRVARKIAKELLNEDCYKIRFYLYINVLPGHMGFGKIEYRFRYYSHY